MSKTLKLTVFVLAVFAQVGFAQSMERIVSVPQAITQCEAMEFQDPEKSIQIAEAGLQLYSEASPTEVGLLNACKAAAYIFLGRMDEARSLVIEVDASRTSTDDIADRFGLLVRLGQLHFQTGDQVSAVELMNEALELATDQDLEEEKSIALGNIAVLLTEIGQYESALAIFEQILEETNEGRHVEIEGGSAVNATLVPVRFNYARALMRVGDYESAIAHLEWLDSQLQDAGQESRHVIALTMLAEAYSRIGDNRALSVLNRAIAVDSNLNSLGSRSAIRRSQVDLFLESGDLQSAERAARERLELNRQVGSQQMFLSSLKSLVEILELRGNYEEALQLHVEFAEANESYLLQQQASRIDLLETRLGVQRREAEILEKTAALRQEEDLRKTIAIALIAIIIIAGLVALLQRNSRKKFMLDRETDNLTGLQDRYSLARQLGSPSFSVDEAAIILLDLDDFNEVNVQIGHKGSDELLRNVGQIVKGAADQFGALAGRWSGERFLLALPDASADSVVELADHLLRSISTVHYTNSDNIGSTLSASLGFAPLSSFKKNSMQDAWESGLEAADMLLARAKSEGRNRAYGVWSIEPKSIIRPSFLSEAVDLHQFRFFELVRD